MDDNRIPLHFTEGRLFMFLPYQLTLCFHITVQNKIKNTPLEGSNNKYMKITFKI